MSGKTDPVFLAAILLIGAAAVATDLKYAKIPNWLTLPALVAGLIFQAFHAGGPGLLAGALGVGAALLFFGVLFGLGWLGGGDVKLLMAFGAWGGPHFSLETGLLAILLGGAMATLVLLFRGELLSFVSRVGTWARSLVYRELVAEPLKLNRASKFPFGLALALAGVWSAAGSPLKRWLGW